jgi:thiol-disulfide isomerase/thioredoxin
MGIGFMRACRAIVAALAFVTSVLGSGALCADEPDKIKIGEFIPAATPQPAPEISLADTSGQSVVLADFKGKFVLVNLWATWCQPCLKEMPSLVALQARLGSALTVLAISEDRGGADVVQPYVAKLGLESLKICLDPKSTATHAFTVQGLPTSFVIDRDGQILGKVEGGAEWDSDKMRAVLDKLLSGSAEPPKSG